MNFLGVPKDQCAIALLASECWGSDGFALMENGLMVYKAGFTSASRKLQIPNQRLGIVDLSGIRYRLHVIRVRSTLR